MILPNKIVRIEESLLFRCVAILNLDFDQIDLGSLYAKSKRQFPDASDFILCIDLLHVIGRINVDLETGVVTNVN